MSYVALMRPNPVAKALQRAALFYPGYTTGTTADLTGRGNDLTNVNTVTTAAGLVDVAAAFDAANSEQLRLANADAGDFLFGDVSCDVVIWVKPDGLDATDEHLIGVYGGAGDRSWIVTVGTGYTGNWRLLLSADGTNTTELQANAANAYANNTWQMLRLGYDMPNNEMFLERNHSGAPVTKTHHGGMYADSGADFEVSGVAGSNYYNGLIGPIVPISGRNFTQEELDLLWGDGNGYALF